ncbi:MAG: 2,3-bisphosphoglycerate-independent phosphoglycerate mutase [Pyrinomonadaceae bacterium]
MVTFNFRNWSFGFDSKSGTARRSPLALIIMDGWGYSNEFENNAIARANTPVYDWINSAYPKTLLEASGERVGLMRGAPGNSEIGHLSLGSGRVVNDELTQIMHSIEGGEFFQNAPLRQVFTRARNRSSSVHLIGQVSDGNVESSIESLFALLRLAKQENVKNVYIHAILDGIDVPQKTADIYIEALQIKLADIGIGEIATLCGRYYAMDDGENWARTARAYTMLVHGEGKRCLDPVWAVQAGYLSNLSDDLIEPVIIERQVGVPVGTIKENDAVIFFNHKTKKLDQLARAIINNQGKKGANKKSFVDAFSLITMDSALKIPAAFGAKVEDNVLGRVFSDNGLFNCRLAETARYSHVTYFFNGRVEMEFPGESRILISDEQEDPDLGLSELGCFNVTDNVVKRLTHRPDEIVIANFATADLIAHSGSFEKTVEAVEHLDSCLERLIATIREIDGVALITSDHGNCEQMFDEYTGEFSSRHTRNPVPLHLVGNSVSNVKLRNNGALEDVAPTILGMLGIEKPFEMTGSDLRIL